MTIQQYQEKCITTATYPRFGNGNYIYPFLGLSGEFGEFYEKQDNYIYDEIEQKKEMGDVMWYLVIISYELGIDMERLRDTEESINTFDVGYKLKDGFLLISKFAEYLKKVERDGNDISAIQVTNFVREIYKRLMLYKKFRGWELDEILQMNIDKLQDRKERNVLHGSGDNR